MKKIAVVSLLVALLIPATNGLAQGLAKGISTVGKLERAVLEGAEKTLRQAELGYATWSLTKVPHVSEVYVPESATFGMLKEKIDDAAHTNGMKVDAYRIANDPKALQSFEKSLGAPLFGKKILASNSEEGLKILRDNQAKAAELRSRQAYEERWAQMPGDKAFENFKDLASWVYLFYTQNGLSENLPRVRRLSPDKEISNEGIICELPVDGLHLKGHPFLVDVSAEQFVVFGNEQIKLVITRRMLEEGYLFEILK